MKKIGKYKYTQKHCLGEGSFGKVYQGFDDHNRRVAIKKVQQRLLATEPYLKESLQSEIEIMKKLKHRNIAQLVDTVITANSIYLIIEFCSGGDLKGYSRGKKHTQEEAKNIITQIVEGFQVIVNQGITHRDLKPANILVHEGIFKICDFGFAKYFGQAGKMAKTCVGTPIYMSPQVLKQKHYSNKTDIWSLGVVYYELLFGKLPYLGKSEDQIFKQITKGKLTIPNCSQFSYLFLKNTLVVQEKDRWSWNQVFDHFQLGAKKQKPGIYQTLTNQLVNNFFNPFSTQKQKQRQKQKNQVSKNTNLMIGNNRSSQNQPKNNNKNGSYKKINFNYQSSSPQNRDQYSPKPKTHGRMPRNIFAATDQQQWGSNYRKPSIIENQVKIIQNECIRKLYMITIQFALKPKRQIPSFQSFIFSLFHFTLGLYHKQIDKYKGSKCLRKSVLIQQRTTLQMLESELKPCKYTDPRQMTTMIQLEGKSLLNLEEMGWLQHIHHAKD